MARLKDPVSSAQATTALQTVADRLATGFPQTEKDATLLATGHDLFGRWQCIKCHVVAGKLPNQEPSAQGTKVCPSQDGATNWYSPAYSPQTGLYYVQTNDKCGIFTRTPMEWEAGKSFMGGTARPATGETLAQDSTRVLTPPPRATASRRRPGASSSRRATSPLPKRGLASARRA